jgi:hypothetical protein
MDARASYPLVPLPHASTTLIPLEPLAVSADSPEEDDTRQLPSGTIGLLALLLGIALWLIRALRLERTELRQQAHFWQAMHARAVQREAQLKQQIEILQAEIRDWQRRMYGRRSETAAATQPQPDAPPTVDTDMSPPKSRPRGQQRHSKGHGRRNHDHLPAQHETHELPQDQRCCPHCRAPFEEIPGSADGTILEIEVKAYRRVYHRQRYRRG